MKNKRLCFLLKGSLVSGTADFSLQVDLWIASDQIEKIVFSNGVLRLGTDFVELLADGVK